jgi:hypothetical protein
LENYNSKREDSGSLGGIAAAAALVVIDDPTAPVQLEMAALEKQVAQLLTGALYTRLGSRDGNLQSFSQVFHAETF